MSRTTCLALALACAACVDPLVDDDVIEDERILPPGSEVPSIYDDPVLAAQIDEHDGVGANIPLLGGFAGGRVAHFRDMGAAPTFAAPVFVLHRRNEAGDLEMIPEHPPVFDTIPGDAGYSPFWVLFALEVTPAYAGEVLPSLAAIQEAQDEGLVLGPKIMPVNINCPVVAEGVTVDTQDGAYPVRRGPFYYKGLRGDYLDFGTSALPTAAAVPRIARYVLRREGGEPLSEPARGVDINDDGDTVDSNDIFSAARSDAAYSPLCEDVLVTVPRETRSIDGDGEPDFTDAAQLFEGGVPKTPPVVAFGATGRRWNCPLAEEPDGAKP